MKLPILSGKEVIKALNRAGFVVSRTKGSHVFLYKMNGSIFVKDRLCTVVPLHPELAKGTLLEILKQCELTREEFMKYLKK